MKTGTRLIPQPKEEYCWIGNSGKSTAKDAILNYVSAFNYSADELIAEPFAPEPGIEFAVYLKLKEA